MDIKIYAKLAGNYLDNNQIRLDLMKKAKAEFEDIKKNRLAQIGDKLDEKVVLFIKGYGNDIELISCFRQIVFNAREILDSILALLNILTAKERVRTSRKFLLFAKSLMRGDYDRTNLEIIPFLKTNITYIFSIRKIRNEIKSNISNIQFRFVTNQLQAYFEVPIKGDEIELIQYLNIGNKVKALENRSYHSTIILDVYFSELIEFCSVMFSIIRDRKA